MSAHHEDRREREDRRHEHRLRPVYSIPHHGLTVSDVQHAQNTRLTELNDQSVRFGGAAISLEPPDLIAGQVVLLARNLQRAVLAGGDAAGLLADDLGAQVLALRLALARSEHDRIDTGDAA